MTAVAAGVVPLVLLVVVVVLVVAGSGAGSVSEHIGPASVSVKSRQVPPGPVATCIGGLLRVLAAAELSAGTGLNG